MAKHVILDTDIGGDPDDTLALLFGLNSPEIQIDLIVTSDEHLGHRAEFARKILGQLGADIPVVQGSDLGNSRWCLVDSLVENSSKKHEPNFLTEIKKIVEQNPETYYVCISPQTNLAAFLEGFPALIPKLKIVIMGGAINYRKKDVAEHNIRCDIKSAVTVFNSKADKKYVLNDITFNPALGVSERHQIFNGLKNSGLPARDIIIKSFQNFFRKLYPECFMHDPLTLSYVIAPEFLTFEQKSIELDKNGIMSLSEGGRLVDVSINAKYGRFMDFLSGRLLI